MLLVRSHTIIFHIISGRTTRVNLKFTSFIFCLESPGDVMPQAFLTVAIQMELMKNKLTNCNKVSTACAMLLPEIKGHLYCTTGLKRN